MIRKVRNIAGAVLAALLVAAPNPVTTGRGADDGVAIRYTELGVPHIKADTYHGLGYGYGYAAARDNVCVLAATYLTVGAERSHHLPADAAPEDGAADAAFARARTNLDSDLYYQHVNDSKVVENALRGPSAPRSEVRDIVRGYVSGYNRYVKDSGVDGISDPSCRGADWVRPISEIDFYRHFHALATVSGHGSMISEIVSAAPGARPAADARPAAPEEPRAALGSNAVAVGSTATRTGRGMLLANPHYPWQGAERFWQAQLTVPGKMNVSGASILGIPLVQIGHTAGAAWSHTVSTAAPYGLYRLRLKPGSPTTYLVDGRPERMTAQKVTVRVKNADGSMSRVQRTLWSTRYGPLTSGAGTETLPWGKDTAHAVRDANRGNLRGLNTWFELGLAHSTEDISRALSKHVGLPWVNTVATDDSGKALFADIQAVPHITDDLAARCGVNPDAFDATGIAVLDGSRGSCAWGSDPDAPQSGIFGPSRLPQTVRRDYVANSNDSPWLTNPKQPMTSYPRVVGDVHTERTPRTRRGITAVEERIGAGRKMSTEALREALFDNRSMIGDLTAQGFTDLCTALPGGKAPTSAGGSVPVDEACDVLADWDRAFTATSAGSLLFNTVWTKVTEAAAPDVWKTPFDPEHPVTTPHTLDTSHPAVRTALGDAIGELRAARIPLTAPIGERQYVTHQGKRIPVPGADEPLGVLNMIVNAPDDQGEPDIVHGSSFIQLVTFNGTQCPDTESLLTYSQSTNPVSAHHADQAEPFAEGELVRERFCESDILRSPKLRTVRLSPH
ncbi:penicillin acylase family protein [Streptomyces sp. NPDC048057]|uniref:penicillin acylase family protein n=1 Tax=Streptomyces sp. NPDC048057 TaxID=3155628 RepID=UPI0033C7C5B1